MGPQSNSIAGGGPAPVLGRARANPAFELVLFDRLPEAELRPLEALARDPELYGVLRSDPARGWESRRGSRDCPFRFSPCLSGAAARLRAGERLGRTSRRGSWRGLVADGVLEVEAAEPGRFVSGAAALLPPGGRAAAGGRLPSCRAMRCATARIWRASWRASIPCTSPCASTPSTAGFDADSGGNSADAAAVRSFVGAKRPGRPGGARRAAGSRPCGSRRCVAALAAAAAVAAAARRKGHLARDQPAARSAAGRLRRRPRRPGGGGGAALQAGAGAACCAPTRWWPITVPSSNLRRGRGVGGAPGGSGGAGVPFVGDRRRRAPLLGRRPARRQGRRSIVAGLSSWRSWLTHRLARALIAALAETRRRRWWGGRGGGGVAPRLGRRLRRRGGALALGRGTAAAGGRRHGFLDAGRPLLARRRRAGVAMSALTGLLRLPPCQAAGRRPGREGAPPAARGGGRLRHHPAALALGLAPARRRRRRAAAPVCRAHDGGGRGDPPQPGPRCRCGGHSRRRLSCSSGWCRMVSWLPTVVPARRGARRRGAKGAHRRLHRAAPGAGARGLRGLPGAVRRCGASGRSGAGTEDRAATARRRQRRGARRRPRHGGTPAAGLDRGPSWRRRPPAVGGEGVGGSERRRPSWRRAWPAPACGRGGVTWRWSGAAASTRPPPRASCAPPVRRAGGGSWPCASRWRDTPGCTGAAFCMATSMRTTSW